MWAKFSGLNPKGSYLSLEKEKETFCVVFTCSAKRAREIRKFHVAVVQRWPKNVQKSVMHVQSCCFTNINLLLCLPFSLPSPSLLPKLPFVVIQKFCYHGNVTSHFTSLLVLSNSRRSIWPTDQKTGNGFSSLHLLYIGRWTREWITTENGFEIPWNSENKPLKIKAPQNRKALR